MTEPAGMTREILHFTKDGKVWHARYTREKRRFGDCVLDEVRKVHGSEEPCTCLQPHSDPRALLGIEEER